MAGVNSNTPMAKVWKRIRKMTGEYSRGRLPCVRVGGDIETDHKKVADALAVNIANIRAHSIIVKNLEQ